MKKRLNIQLSLFLANNYSIIILIIILFLSGFSQAPAFAQNTVRLGLVGEWNNNLAGEWNNNNVCITEFHAVKVWKSEEVREGKKIDMTYAFCATSNGMTVCSYEGLNQGISSAKASLISFVTIGGCTNIVIDERGFEKDIYTYITAGDQGLYIRNVTNPALSSHIGSCDTPGDAQGVTISGSGDYAYVADGENGLQVINIKNPNEPHIARSCDTPGDAQGVTISGSGDYAYVADGEKGLQVINIKNPNEPHIVGSCDTPGDAQGVTISGSGDYAYVADGENGLQVINIKNPNEPHIARSCDTPGDAQGVTISGSGDYAYVADGESGLQVIEIKDLNSLHVVGMGDPSISGDARGIAISRLGEYAYVADGDLHVIYTNSPNGLQSVGICDTPGDAYGIAISGSGDYACVADGESGLQVIEIKNPNEPHIVGSCDTPGYAQGVAISGDYAYVADGESGLQVIKIKDPNRPHIVGSCDTFDDAQELAISGLGDYAYVADGESGLQVIKIKDPNRPHIVGSCDTHIMESDSPVGAEGVAISGDYAYVADGDGGLQVIEIKDPSEPHIVGSCFTSGFAQGVAISGDYAYVTGVYSGLEVIEIKNPNGPHRVGRYNTPGWAYGVIIVGSGDYAYVTDGINDSLLKLKINIGPPPAGKGNLILVAGGDINYKAFTDENTNYQARLRKRGGPLDPIDLNASCWQVTQSLANHVFTAFRNKGYEPYEIYYFNPDPLQDIDNDGTPNQLVIDNTNPTKDKLKEVIIKLPKQHPDDITLLPQDHLANDGPLYIYLIGHAAENCFLIMANEVITAKELKDAITEFQEETEYKRQVVVVIESAASGTFADDLAGPGTTVITSTDGGASYIKPDTKFDLSNPDIPYNSFTTAFIRALAPHLDPNNIPAGPQTLPDRINTILKGAFITVRNQLQDWASKGTGPAFTDQAPQMTLPDATFASLSFSKVSQDGITSQITPIQHQHLVIGSHQDIPTQLTIVGYAPVGYAPTSLLTDTGHDPNSPPIPINQKCTFFSSDTTILDPQNPEDIRVTYSPSSLSGTSNLSGTSGTSNLSNPSPPSGILTYTITPRKNGIVSLIAYPTDINDPHHLLSAQLTIEVSMDDPKYNKDMERMAIIVAGYQGTGDSLWDSTNTIANHAYMTLRAMGYTRQEIYYYSPYFLQDLDGNGKIDDIDGYPKPDIFSLDTDLQLSLLSLCKDKCIKYSI